jgi:membrane-associated protease RseP (regulator of RpoE activity)
VDPARHDDEPFPTPDDDPLLTPALAWQPRRKFQDRLWVHAVLLVLTIASTTFLGLLHYTGFLSDLSAATPVDFPSTLPQLIVQAIFHGFWYSGTILAILGSHELGHYFACRYYDVDASLPFFIPFPFGPSGTLGAVIRIREPIPTKRMLFDIGIAGPIAGFVVAVPALIVGIAISNVVRLPPNFTGYELGEPLVFKAVEWVFWGVIPDGYSLNMHPMALAAWLGLLVTALNLFPAIQLDGGHISYALFGRRSVYVTGLTLVTLVLLASYSSFWIGWTIVLFVMLAISGPRHPRVFDENTPLDRTRLTMAVVAAVILILCFTPAPIEPSQILRR